MNIEPDFAEYWSGLKAIAFANWKWLAVCGFCFLLGVAL